MTQEAFWFVGLDYAPPAERLNEARFQRGYNFAYGDEFRPLLTTMVRARLSPRQQLQKIERKLTLLTEALELSQPADALAATLARMS